MLQGELHQLVGDALDVAAQHAQDVEQGRERNAHLDQLCSGMDQPRPRCPEAQAVGLQDAELGHAADQRRHFREFLALGEQRDELRHREIARQLLRPGRGDGGFQPQQVAKVLALFPGRDELGDIAERVSAVEQLVDEPQAREVIGRVDAGATALLGRR